MTRIANLPLALLLLTTALTGCLDSTSMSRADLTDANLSYADLQFALFEDAIVNNANFDFSWWYQTVWTDGIRYDTNQS